MSKKTDITGPNITGDNLSDCIHDLGEDKALLTMGHRKYKASIAYARAIFYFASQFGLLEAMSQSFNEFISVWYKLPVLQRFISCHAIDRNTRKGQIERFFKDRVHTGFIYFVEKLVDNNHTDLLPGIYDAFCQMVDEVKQQRKLRVISAIPMKDVQLKQLKKAMEGFLNLQIRIKNEVDPEILGGFICYTDSIKIDMSLKKDLEKLKSRVLSMQCGGNKDNEG